MAENTGEQVLHQKEPTLHDKKRLADMKRLTEIDERNNDGEKLTIDEIRFLYQFDSKIEGFGRKENQMIKEIVKKRDIKSDLSLVTGYPKEQISTTEKEALSGGIKIHWGDLNLSELKSVKGFNFPEERIMGNLNLWSLRSAEGVKLSKEIDGDLDLSTLESAEGLKFPEKIGNRLKLFDIKSAKGLKLPKEIGSDLWLTGLYPPVEGLKLPKIGGTLWVYGTMGPDFQKIIKKAGRTDIKLSVDFG